MLPPSPPLDRELHPVPPLIESNRPPSTHRLPFFSDLILGLISYTIKYRTICLSRQTSHSNRSAATHQLLPLPPRSLFFLLGQSLIHHLLCYPNSRNKIPSFFPIFPLPGFHFASLPRSGAHIRSPPPTPTH
ncbi:hypothetical protein IE53DRAFT_228908 [Violaceomyces palustris]|uniref:Uncharacterized protein n=1 Tax=Violaceomyces palustris TaxID=1673888 RepID=A0ACD0P4M1_9BASI|nr:hypothetical protein IE53DRAFT_228908 [Violaceomyces palustris]